MSLLVILIILFVLFGSGYGYYGSRYGGASPYGFGGLFVFLLVIWLIFGRG